MVWKVKNAAALFTLGVAVRKAGCEERTRAGSGGSPCCVYSLFFCNSYTSTYLTVAFGSKKTLTKVQTQPKEQNLDKR